jgi:hypothetical protein
MLIKLYHPYKCKHCSKTYAIVPGKFWDSLLPVEILNGTEQNDGEFDKERHTSHLLNCPKLQAQWENVKRMILEQIKTKEKLSIKDALR